MMNNATERQMAEMPYFVGYDIAKHGIGMAMIKESKEDAITLAVCGDDGKYGEFFDVSRENFNKNMERMYSIIEEVGLENIVSE